MQDAGLERPGVLDVATWARNPSAPVAVTSMRRLPVVLIAPPTTS
jgi:hypothetical protein